MASNLEAVAIQEFRETTSGESNTSLNSKDSSRLIDDIFTWEDASEEFTKLLTILRFFVSDNNSGSKEEYGRTNLIKIRMLNYMKTSRK